MTTGSFEDVYHVQYNLPFQDQKSLISISSAFLKGKSLPMFEITRNSMKSNSEIKLNVQVF